jgi:hypothetical protein
MNNMPSLLHTGMNAPRITISLQLTAAVAVPILKNDHLLALIGESQKAL